MRRGSYSRSLLAAAAFFLPAAAWGQTAPGAPAPRPTPRPGSFAAVNRAAREAYAKKDYEEFLRKTRDAARLAPGDVFVLYNLACGQALTGRSADALRTLNEIAARQVRFELSGDADLASLRGLEGYRRIGRSMEALSTVRRTSSVVAFTIPEKGLVPEGIAWDPRTRSFFVASIRKRKVMRIDPGGKSSEFVKAGQDGLRSAMGMRIDPGTRTLWIASQALENMIGYSKEHAPDSALFEYDLDTGRLRREHRPPPGGPPPGFDDLTLAADGAVFVNDATATRIYVHRPGTTGLELFLDDPDLGAPQGLAFSADGRLLYVSNYGGLRVVDMATRRVAALDPPGGITVNGIDGLAFYGGSLVAVQNGIEPNRVVRLTLSPDGRRLTGGTILEMNSPQFDEPTLGTVAEGAFYYVADSQGARFRKETPPSDAEQREAVILKIPLR